MRYIVYMYKLFKNKNKYMRPGNGGACLLGSPTDRAEAELVLPISLGLIRMVIVDDPDAPPQPLGRNTH